MNVARRTIYTSIDGASASSLVHSRPRSLLQCRSLYSRTSGESSQTVLPVAAQADLTSTSGLARLSTPHLLRNIILGASFSIPTLQKSSLAFLRVIANSKSTLLNPDANPLLRAIIKPILYKQFCAGVDRPEIFKTRDENKRLGYSGVILCYGKEVRASGGVKISNHDDGAQALADIECFRDGNLETLRMIGSGDWLGIKFTGAGSLVTQAAIDNREAPAAFVQAMDDICKQAISQQIRVYIDAEQQIVQKAIDQWTLDLMRKYNKDGKANVYTTAQAYLKSSRHKLANHLSLADKEHFTYGVKLVRGAYIDSETRDLIHDTKQDTDASYNGIVQSLLSGNGLGFSPQTVPPVRLLIAGHNPESISTAWQLVQDLNKKDQLKVNPDFAMLQGMGDVVGCKVLQQVEVQQREQGTRAPLRIYKCLTWGSVQECMLYLFRRVVENSGSPMRMRDGLEKYNAELRRRMRKVLGLQRRLT